MRRTKSNQENSRGFSRRNFLATTMASTMTLTMLDKSKAEETLPIRGKNDGRLPSPINLHINGRNYQLSLDVRTSLLDALREHIGLTGTKKGCDHGQCGACTVLLDGKRALSCLTFATMAQDHE